MDAEKSHHLALRLARHLPFLIQQPSPYNPVRVLGLDFKNPIGLAAGFDKNGEYLDVLSQLGFGFIEVGSVTPLPQAGNSKPRLFRLPEQEALVNRMGLNNLGVENLAKNLERFQKNCVIGASFTKNTQTPLDKALDDYLICFERLQRLADYLVADVSCPNTNDFSSNSNLEFLDTLCEQLKVRKSRHVPILLKLSPDWDFDFLKALSQILLRHSIDGVICGNTSAGLSGKPLFPKTLRLVKSMHGLLENRIPIIGCGGISSSHDITEMQQAGAKLLQVYTALIYQGPGVVSKICPEQWSD